MAELLVKCASLAHTEITIRTTRPLLLLASAALRIPFRPLQVFLSTPVNAMLVIQDSTPDRALPVSLENSKHHLEVLRHLEAQVVTHVHCQPLPCPALAQHRQTVDATLDLPVKTVQIAQIARSTLSRVPWVTRHVHFARQIQLHLFEA